MTKQTTTSPWFRVANICIALVSVGSGLLMGCSAKSLDIFVDARSASPVPPYTNWNTAAHVLQDAIDSARDGDTVVVADGTYDAGGRAVRCTMTNRIAVTKHITIRSVNGPSYTTIKGFLVKEPIGAGTNQGWRTTGIRCAYLGAGSILAGFTLSGGVAQHYHTNMTEECRLADGGGGAFCEEGAVISNCIVEGCFAAFGGGVVGGHIIASSIVSNHAVGLGGGVYEAALETCTIGWNVAASGHGGGLWRSEARGCRIEGNRATDTVGGGAADSTLRNCVVLSNSAWSCAGVYGGCAENCTVVRNRATQSWGAGMVREKKNCLAWQNTASNEPPAALGSGYVDLACDLVLSDGIGIASLRNPRLLAGSPCINAGTNTEWKADAVDIDGEPRLNGGVDIGADEFWPEGLTGRLDVAILVDYTNAVVSQPLRFETELWGKPQGYVWNLGDGGTATNLCVVQHAYMNAGRYEVSLTTWNLSGTTTCTRVINVK